MEFMAKMRWWNRATTFTTPWNAGFQKGDVITVSGLTNASMNGEYRITKVRRGWLHWYDPIVMWFKKVFQRIFLTVFQKFSNMQ